MTNTPLTSTSNISTNQSTSDTVRWACCILAWCTFNHSNLAHTLSYALSHLRRKHVIYYKGASQWQSSIWQILDCDWLMASVMYLYFNMSSKKYLLQRIRANLNFWEVDEPITVQSSASQYCSAIGQWDSCHHTDLSKRGQLLTDYHLEHRLTWIR